MHLLRLCDSEEKDARNNTKDGDVRGGGGGGGYGALIWGELGGECDDSNTLGVLGLSLFIR